MRKISVPIVKKFQVGDEVVDLDAILNAPFEDIGEAAERIPGILGWFGYQKGLAIEREINADYNWKEAEAVAYFALKGGGFVEKGYGEKITETALEKAVLLDEAVKAAALEYAKRKRHLEWVNGTIEALKAKMELVRSTEATRRMEHEPDRNKGTTV